MASDSLITRVKFRGPYRLQVTCASENVKFANPNGGEGDLDVAAEVLFHIWICRDDELMN